MGRIRRRTVARTAWVLLLLGVIAAFLPLPGPVPMRYTYDGDSGGCETLFYRSAATVSIALVSWGGVVVQGPH